MVPVHMRIAILRDRVMRAEKLRAEMFAEAAMARGVMDPDGNVAPEKLVERLSGILNDLLFLEDLGVLEGIQALFAAEAKATPGQGGLS